MLRPRNSLHNPDSTRRRMSESNLDPTGDLRTTSDPGYQHAGPDGARKTRAAR